MVTFWHCIIVVFLVNTLPFALPVEHAAAQAGPAPVEPRAGSWKTHVLASGSDLRLPAPPDRAATQAELVELKALAGRRDATALDQISYWDAGWPGYRWIDIGMSSGLKQIGRLGGFGQYRLVTLLSVAMYDATVAAWDSKYAHNRPRPNELDPSIVPLIATPRSPSYPSEHAVVAGAAAAMLAYLIPQDAQL